MKLRKLLTMGLCSALALLTFGASHLRAEEDKGEKTKIPETVEGIFAAIHQHHMELTETVKAKKLADVHHHAFAIRDLANALPAKAAADKKKAAEGTVKNIATLAAALDESGDANDQPKTEANLKKMDGLVKVLDVQFGQKPMTMPPAK